MNDLQHTCWLSEGRCASQVLEFILSYGGVNDQMTQPGWRDGWTPKIEDKVDYHLAGLKPGEGGVCLWFCFLFFDAQSRTAAESS
jgi:hypothetical protein